MAKKLNQQDLLKLSSINTPPTDSVAFAAKSDGLYQKIGDEENKIATTKELSDKVKTDVPEGAKFTDTNTTYSASTGLTLANTVFSVDFGEVAKANHTHTFASLTSRPTTLKGYGLTEIETNLRTTTSGLTVLGVDAALNLTGAGGQGSTAFGYKAAESAVESEWFTAIGRNAGQFNVSGHRWSAFGQNAGQNNISGSDWLAFGANAGRYNTTGELWTAIGGGAGGSNTTGGMWTAIGSQAGYANTTGQGWLAIGVGAGYSNLASNYWLAIGAQAGQENTSGASWTAIGFDAGKENLTGNAWTAIGSSAAKESDGSFFTAIGLQAGVYNSSNEWVAIGFKAAENLPNGTSPALSASNSVHIGSRVKVSADGVTNEIAIGYNAIGKGSNTVVIGNDDITKTYLNGEVHAPSYKMNGVDLKDSILIAANEYIDINTQRISEIDETTSASLNDINSQLTILKDEVEVAKAEWTSKETPEGAQEKATDALESAKTYVDDKVGDISFSPIELTYSELKGLIDNSELVPHQTYLIVDYQTIYKVPFISDINTSDIEPLLVVASSSSTLFTEAKSTQYPQDEITYIVDEEPLEIPGAAKGWITRRCDTKTNISMAYDFRTIKFRRYKATAPEYDSTKLYKDGEVCFFEGNFYVSIYPNNIGNSLTDINWFYNLGYPNEGYILLSPTNKTIGNLNFQTTPEYREYLTFEDYDLMQDIYQEMGDRLDSSELRLEWSNNVFLTGGLQVRSLFLGGRVANNLFLGGVVHIALRNACYHNMFDGNLFNMNSLTHVRYNWFKAEVNQFDCSGEFSRNILVSDSTIGWIISNYFADNRVNGSLLQSNIRLVVNSIFNGSNFYITLGFVRSCKFTNVSNSVLGETIEGVNMDSCSEIFIDSKSLLIDIGPNLRYLHINSGCSHFDLEDINFDTLDGGVALGTKTIYRLPGTDLKLTYLLADGTEKHILIPKASGVNPATIIVPVHNISAGTYTIKAITGMQTYVDGVLTPAGTYTVEKGTRILIEHRVRDNYKIYSNQERMWQLQF